MFDNFHNFGGGFGGAPGAFPVGHGAFPGGHGAFGGNNAFGGGGASGFSHDPFASFSGFSADHTGPQTFHTSMHSFDNGNNAASVNC